MNNAERRVINAAKMLVENEANHEDVETREEDIARVMMAAKLLIAREQGKV